MLLLLASVAVLHAQPPSPDTAEHNAILARVSSYALGYTNHLQDFICTQVTRRSYGPPGGRRFKNLDTFKEELSYFQRKENYRLLKVNGKPATAGRSPKGGFFRARGEFGTYMAWISIRLPTAEYGLLLRIGRENPL